MSPVVTMMVGRNDDWVKALAKRDGKEQQFFAGVLGIFRHGNIASIGQTLQQNPGFRYILTLDI